MTYINDLFLNRCQAGYWVEWFFEEIHPKALSYSITLDEDKTIFDWRNLADQITPGFYSYRASFLIKPRRYATLRVIRLVLFDGYSHEKPSELERIAVLNSPRLLPMTERYD